LTGFIQAGGATSAPSSIQNVSSVIADTSAFSAPCPERRSGKTQARGSRVLAGKKAKIKKMFARVRTYNPRFAAIAAQVKYHPARFPTMAVNCEFSPTTRLPFMAFGKAVLVNRAIVILPKDLKWQDCAVKIPDWKSHRGFSNLHRSFAATKPNTALE
jgi:hypothetical protein